MEIDQVSIRRLLNVIDAALKSTVEKDLFVLNNSSEAIEHTANSAVAIYTKWLYPDAPPPKPVTWRQECDNIIITDPNIVLNVLTI
jgi:hypothetical protein